MINNSLLVSKQCVNNIFNSSTSVNNDTFNVIPGSGQPWRQQYQINTAQSDDITGWKIDFLLPIELSDSQAIVTKNRAYLLGGWNGCAVPTVYTAPINDNGIIGTWTISTPLPVAVCFSQVIIIKNRVYLLGGRSIAGHLSTVYTAPINSDGTLGSWTTSTPLPGPIAHSQAIVTKNRVYLLGGYSNTNFLSTVYTASINSDGTLGTWTISTSLPIRISNSQAVVTKNRVYLLGGYNNSDGALSTIYTASINSDGTLGTWIVDTSLPIAIEQSQAVVTKNRVYLLGGRINGNHSSTVYTTSINSDGTLGRWTINTSLLEKIVSSQAIVTKNRVYLLGGYNSTGFLPTVYTAPFSGGLNDYLPYYDCITNTIN